MPKRGYNSDRAWETRQRKLQREHERNMALIDLFKEDPSWFYKIGLITGSLFTVATAIGASATEDHNNSVFPDGISLPGVAAPLFIGGLTFTTWCAMMLTVPQLFGPDGIQVEASAGGYGFEGEFKLG